MTTQAAAQAAAPAAGRLQTPEWRRRLLRFGVRPFLLGSDLAAWLVATLLSTGGPAGRDVMLLAVLVALFALGGLYRSRLTLSALDDLPRLVGRTLGAAAAVTAVGLWLDAALADAGTLRTAAVLAGLVVVGRTVAYAVVRRCRAAGWVAHPTLVLGAGRVGVQLVELLRAHPSYGLVPVGFLDSDPLVTDGGWPVPVLGGQEALARVIVEFGVRDVVVAFGAMPESAVVDVIRTCDRLDVEIFFVPRLFEVHQVSRDMDQVWGLPLVRLRRAAFRTVRWRVKRAVDVLAALVGLVLLSPVLAVCAVAVWAEGGWPVLFFQERVGVDGRSFRVVKFRSLRPADEGESQTRWSVAADGRLGPVGRVLRAWSLDELPQLWNILRGDMTVVGPRPERPHFVAEFARSFPRYVARHRVPAGLTGWAQVHGLRGDTSIADRARFDNYYIENWSLWADTKIVLRTVGAVLRRTGS